MDNSKLHAFRVEVSDRARGRNIKAESASEAVQKAIGKRLLHTRLDSYRNDGFCCYEAAVSTGPTVNGSTPFKNVRVYVNNQ